MALFSTEALNEPPKAALLNYKPGMALHREAFAVDFDRVNNKTYEAIIDPAIKKIISWKLIPGAEPLVFLSEYDTLSPIIKADAPGCCIRSYQCVNYITFSNNYVTVLKMLGQIFIVRKGLNGYFNLISA